MKKIPIDIMLHGQFVATLRMPLRPWPFTEDEVREFVLSKLPTAQAGDYGAARAGNYGAAQAGDYGAAQAGDYGAAIVSNDGRVKGGYGCVLVARNIEYSEETKRYEVTDWACAIVDGKDIKPDAWYRLKDGKLVEDND